MKKYLECIWMRMLAALLCAVSVIGLMASMLPTLFFWTSDQSGVYKTGKDKIASNYALYIYDEWTNERQAITSDSSFMPSSCRGQSELRWFLRIGFALRHCDPLLPPL